MNRCGIDCPPHYRRSLPTKTDTIPKQCSSLGLIVVDCVEISWEVCSIPPIFIRIIL